MKSLRFVLAWTDMQRDAHEISVAHGWWPVDGRNDGECIALMHSELSEALVAVRNGNPGSDHLPGISCLEEELADVVLRIMDYAEARHFDLGPTIIAKNEFNRSRPKRHGGKLF